MVKRSPTFRLRRLARKGAAAAALCAALAAGLAAPAWAQDGAKLFADTCAGCHGAKGKGDGPAAAALSPGPGDFVSALAGKSDDWIFKAIKGGGPAVGKSAGMPPFGSALNDAEIKALTAYVKQLASPQ